MKKELIVFFMASLMSYNAYCQQSQVQGLSVSINMGLSVPTGDELSNVFDQGVVIHPAVQRGFILPNLKGELAFDVIYQGNNYSDFDGEVRDNLWLYGISVNALYDITVFQKLIMAPKVGIGYMLGDNYLTSDNGNLQDKQKGLHSNGLLFNGAISLLYKRFNITMAYTLHKPAVKLDESLLESVGSKTSDLYGKTISDSNQKMNFSYLSFTLGYKFLQL